MLYRQNMVNICTVASRKGGVGKTTVAYEMAYLLDAVLVDLEWDGGSASRKWGFRAEERARDVMLDALEAGRAPRPLKGFRKPTLVPGTPELIDVGLSAEEWTERLGEWSETFGRDWVVIDTHPGASPSAHGAMAVADIVLTPAGLRTDDLNGVEQLIHEMADYPLAVVPNLVRRVPPAAEVARLGRMVEGTPVRVAPPIPYSSQVETRKRRMAMTGEEPVPKRLTPVVEALTAVAEFTKEYVR